MSKRLPEAVQFFSITEIELYGLAINIAKFGHLLIRVDFNAIDLLGWTHIIKSKAEPATTTIKRLLEVLSSYLFNLYYIKGKDMIFSDYLSRQKHDDSDPHEIILISFNMQEVLHAYYYNIHEHELKRYLIKINLRQELVEQFYQRYMV